MEPVFKMKVKKKILYLEFFIPIGDYFSTIKKNEIIFEWLIPLLLSIGFYFGLSSEMSFEKIVEFNGYVINSLAILIGFSITCLTILSTSNNHNITELKNGMSERKIGNKNICLFQLIYITFSFSLFMELFTLTYDLMYYLLYSAVTEKIFAKATFTVSIFLVFNIIFLTIRNITNFYLIFYKQESV